MIQTARLRISMATDTKMRQIIAAESVPELRLAYQEMYNNSIAHPEQRQWHILWLIRESYTQNIVGSLCFHGITADGMVEIGYGLNEGYTHRGYMTEAVRAVADWALRQDGVQRVESEAEADNAPSLRVLERCGFVPAGEMGEEGPRFVYQR